MWSAVVNSGIDHSAFTYMFRQAFQEKKTLFAKNRKSFCKIERVFNPLKGACIDES
jgi:cell division protein FtsL